MKSRLVTIAPLLFVLFCASCSTIDESAIRQEITETLTKQADAWNNADLDGYMRVYEESDSVRFASGGTVTFGWKTVRDRMKRAYPDAETMGTLVYTDIDIKILNDESALVFGKWILRRSTDTPWGLFTLLVRRTETGWKIVADHTSSASRG